MHLRRLVDTDHKWGLNRAGRLTCLGLSPLLASASLTHSNSTISASSLAAFMEIAAGTVCTAATAHIIRHLPLASIVSCQS